MMITTNSNITLMETGNMIQASDGKTYTIMGSTIMGPTGTIAQNVKSHNEALGIIIGLYGGKRM